MLTPVEDYQLTLKVEVIKERGAPFYHGFIDTRIVRILLFDDEANPWILMSDDFG